MKKQSVSEVIAQIKNLLEGELKFLSIEGEVSNLSSSAAGHWYFSLSDSDALISCALFKMDAFRNPIIKKIKDGDKVVCSGNIGVYGKRGTFQLIVQGMEVVGKGDLKEQFEKLKKSLAAQGFFDLERKKKIPEIPKRVAMITALGGAALQDFLNVYKRRAFWMDILIVPALVQGDAAPKSLVAALSRILEYAKANPDKAPQVIVLSRGGGSLEDLWAFNDETLAHAIFNCPIPVISAVGHQVDFSICDFVADLRCETPTAAAEVLTQHQTMIREKLGYARRRLENGGNILLTPHGQKLQRLTPVGMIDKLWLAVKEKYFFLDESMGKMKNLAANSLEKYKSRIDRCEDLLQSMNPRSVLQRGYSFLSTSENRIIENLASFQGIPDGEILRVQFFDGTGHVEKK